MSLLTSHTFLNLKLRFRLRPILFLDYNCSDVTWRKRTFWFRLNRALAGWRKLDPGHMRVPVPEEFLWDLRFLAVEQQRLDIAMNLTLQYDGYMRPSECLSLHSSQVNAPANRRYPHWAIVMAPSAWHETTKTGSSDDSILIGDLPHNRWICECLRLWMRTVPKQGVPSFLS